MRLSPIEEERLVKQAKRGRCSEGVSIEAANRAFEKLWCAYKDAVKGFISSYLCPHQRKNDLEDLVQNTCMEVLQRIYTYDPERGSFYTWVCIWARIVLKRYFDEKNQYMDSEVLMSELAAIAPEEGWEIEEVEAIPVAPTEQSLIEPNPEEIVERLEKFKRFLSIALPEGGEPHQLIAFGFIQLLEWTPQQIVEELADTPLEELARRLEGDYVRTSQYLGDRVRKYFEPLHQKMQRRLEGGKLVGETRLSDYWGERPTDNLSNWCYRVRQRTIQKMVERGLDC